jgi:hypothetical protein
MEITWNEKDKQEVPMKKNRNERGQSLVIIAIAFLALVAMVALIIDGGSLYLNRRNAQTAADAAALAGAHELCVNKGSDSAIQDIVDQYAITENGATAVENVDIDRTNKAVVVQTMLETSSFFAGILGYESNTVRAEASAGCFVPATGKNLLPIAWNCRPPVGGTTDDCEIASIPWTVFKTLLTFFNFGPGQFESMLLTEGDGVNYQTYNDTIGGKMAYLVMDSDSFDPATNCMELNAAGTINCDFDDDGVLEVEGGANRGWLLLDGGTGANDLVNVMLNGYPAPITLPHWFPGKSGVSNNVFINAHQIKFKPSLVPVFNAVCPDTNDSDIPTVCSTDYETGDLISGSSGLKTYYRVASFAPFVVTCVSKGTSEKCPAKSFANIKGNVSTIEGYFVSGYIAGTDIDPNGFDLGVYIISLTK